jgi:lipoprotein-anchoring transpeptidase ErfK/SrfK
MSDKRILPDLSRRRLIGTAAAWGAIAAASPAIAQARRRNPYEDPYHGGSQDDFWQGSARYRTQPRDTFYNTQVQQDYYIRDPFGSGQQDPNDPYGNYPYGSRRRTPSGETRPVDTPVAGGGFDYRRIYGRIDTEPFPVPAVNYSRIGAEFLRREVSYSGSEPAGTIVVDPRARHLYFVQGNGRAVRYGVGVGRQGFAWSGNATVNSKQEWPDWYPPKEMIARDPKLARSLSELQSGIGMHGGPGNPLGARALYLWQGNKDTLYRIHGTTEPWTIGTRASSGCIRMVNQDAIDLYARANVGAEVRVLG